MSKKTKSTMTALYDPLKHCHGLFRGALPFPVPLSCDNIHFLLGVLSGTLPPQAQILSVVLFVAYQAVEELNDWDVRSFVKDVGIFLLGFALSVTIWYLVKPPSQPEEPVGEAS